ncbi:ABC-type multidrug transport system fused ATPase/permease subunit [Antricoccus suffuscus]|uniref:ABC-type multidrug transport system fused ATPase/permease subunit n=1 Tax=Antricoccus suffuscus TaxID=1629062 RepID=A0A2T0ZYH7_9ACTN|nr:ABC transporter ATP-binding protein [Antricoccus suffuscus]PRZ41138.1 ABC-type multidrug transport system fused ATPase/permease subunit [Antricoccus suffuscus]
MTTPDSSTASGLKDWRGVATEDQDALSDDVTLMLRGRSRRLLIDLIAPHKKKLWLLMVAVVIQNFAMMAGPILVSIGIDNGIPSWARGERSPMITVIVAMAVAFIVDGLLRWYFLMGFGRIGQQIVLEIRRRLFRHFQRLSLSFHEKYTSGRVVSRQTNDLESLDELIDAGLDGFVGALLSVVSVCVILLFLDPMLAVVVLLSIPVVLYLLHWFRRRSSVAFRRTRETSAAYIVHFVETFIGIRAVHVFRRAPRNSEIAGQLNDENREANAYAYWLLAIFVPGIKITGSIAMTVCLVYGGLRVMDGDIKIGVLAAFLLYLRRFFDPMTDLGMFFNAFQSGMASLEKISGILEEEPSVADPDNPVALPNARGEVQFDGVGFAYNADNADVLPKIDLRLPAGQTVALVGATGAGKTTIARLLCRFYDPQHGVISIDGVDLRNLSDDDLRRAIVMVTQESFLFSGSVADNISIGKPEATREEIVAAAQAVGAHGFIARLPDGYDTDVRKRGGRLSAGQRQLVAFARVFLADPAVLILDEATSSLDVPSERLVQRALATILADRTAIIIAHRLSTVEIADRVLVLDRGQIIEDGQPDDLVNGTGRFAALHDAWRDSLV